MMMITYGIEIEIEMMDEKELLREVLHATFNPLCYFFHGCHCYRGDSVALPPA